MALSAPDDIVLADTSAWTASRRSPELAAWFNTRVIDGLIAICRPVQLELLHEAKSHREFLDRRMSLEALPVAPCPAEAWDRAIASQQRLASTRDKFHRMVTRMDLVIAAVAELAGMPLLHYDRDFERIAGVTGQTAHWIAPRGSL